jgi:hypothetical protein
MQPKCQHCGAINPVGKILCISCGKAIVSPPRSPGPVQQPPSSRQLPLAGPIQHPAQQNPTGPPPSQSAVPPIANANPSNIATSSSPPQPVQASQPTRQQGLFTLEKFGIAATTVAALIGAFFLLFPALQPQPPAPLADPTATPPPAVLAAYIEYDVYTLYRGRTLLDYVRETKPEIEGAISALETIPDVYELPDGVEVKAIVQFMGFRNRTCYLQWTLYDAITGSAVPGLIDHPALPSDTYIAEADTDQWTWTFYVPVNGLHGSYYVDMRLLDDRKQELRGTDSEVFFLP